MAKSKTNQESEGLINESDSGADFLASQKKSDVTEVDGADKNAAAQIKFAMAWAKNKFSQFFPRTLGEGGVLATDLIKGELITFFDWQKNLVSLGLLLLLDFIIIFVGFKGVEFWQAQKQQEVDQAVTKFNEIQREKSQAEVRLDEIVAFQKKLDQISLLLRNHKHWTYFFKYLEDNTQADTYFDKFEGSTAGSYQLSAHISNFSSLGQQLATYKNDPYTQNVVVEGASIDKRDAIRLINFKLNLTVDKKLFTDDK